MGISWEFRGNFVVLSCADYQLFKYVWWEFGGNFVGIWWELFGNFKGRKRAWGDKGNLREDLREDLRERWVWWAIRAIRATRVIRGGGRRWSGLMNQSNAEFSLGRKDKTGNTGNTGRWSVRNWRIVGELAKGAF